VGGAEGCEPRVMDAWQDAEADAAAATTDAASMRIGVAAAARAVAGEVDRESAPDPAPLAPFRLANLNRNNAARWAMKDFWR